MNLTRPTASTVLILRIGYGVGLIAAPGRLAQRWLGESALVSLVLAGAVDE